MTGTVRARMLTVMSITCERTTTRSTTTRSTTTRSTTTRPTTTRPTTTRPSTTRPSTTRPTDMLRHVDGVELPAAGTWAVPPHHATISLFVPRRLRRPEPRLGRATYASLVFSDEPEDVAVDVVLRSTALAAVRGDTERDDQELRVTAWSAGGAQPWTLAGTALADGSVRAVRATLGYHGVWRRGDRPYGWFVVAGVMTPPTGSMRSHVGFSFELLADAPELAVA
jgi:hypothetical protein